MENLDIVMGKIINRCKASGLAIVDLKNGDIVRIINNSDLPQEVMELACGAAVEMFKGQLVNKMFFEVGKYRPTTSSLNLESIRFTFTNAYHWMTLVKNYIVILVAPKLGVSAGYIETVFRSYIPQLESNLE